MTKKDNNEKWLFVSDVDDTILGDEEALENAEIRDPAVIAAQVEASRKGRIW